MKQDDIPAVIELACETLGIPEFAPKVRWEFSTRMTQGAGKAFYRQRLIRIGLPYWNAAPDDDKENTIYHEVCHLIARHKFGWNIKSHGPEWKHCMLACGQEPRRCHTVDTGVPRRRHRYKVNCGCLNGQTLSPTRFNKLQRGTARYRCLRCGRRITL